MNLNRVILSWPTLLSTLAAQNGDATPRSWIQLAKTGTFHSSRYGKFSITREDLAQMLHNFENITPTAPTELPVDLDHLSMDPKRPGDGIAAGWMKKLDLREGGTELWAEVEWTEDGAERIRKKEYRFVSPSFVKDHTHKDGKRIGTTLLAAAITNHPFLEGMQALTLYSFSTMGDLALAATPPTSPPVHLAELEQRISFNPADEETVPELSPAERSATYVVKGVRRGFVKLAMLDGTPYGWFPEEALGPARAADQTNQEDTTMQDTKTTDIEQKAAAFAERVTALSKGRTTREAISLAMTKDAEGAEAYRLAGIGHQKNVITRPVVVHHLHRKPDEGFAELVGRVSHEQRIDLHAAYRVVRESYPELAGAYERGESL